MLLVVVPSSCLLFLDVAYYFVFSHCLVVVTSHCWCYFVVTLISCFFMLLVLFICVISIIYIAHGISSYC
jgi:hypothetical protein